MYFYFYQNSIFLILGHKYQSYQIVEILHPDVMFKAEILIRVIYSVDINRSKIIIEKYYKTTEKIISTITPIICNNYLIRHRNFCERQIASYKMPIP